MMQSDTGLALAFLLKLSPSPTSEVLVACLLQKLKEAKQARRPQFRGGGVEETRAEHSGWVLQTWILGAESKNSPSPHRATVDSVRFREEARAQSWAPRLCPPNSPTTVGQASHSPSLSITIGTTT